MGTSQNSVKTKFGIAPSQAAQDCQRGIGAPAGIVFLMYTTLICT
jgi:hypothetical protein